MREPADARHQDAEDEPSATSTLRAFLPSGGWKAPTASLTASMPVSDAPPLAKARSRVKIITPVMSPSVPGPMV